MCQFSNGQNDPACTDLTNARNGIKTFLGFMDPTIDMVSLSVLPPAINAANPCQTPASGTKNYGYDACVAELGQRPRKHSADAVALRHRFDAVQLPRAVERPRGS